MILNWLFISPLIELSFQLYIATVNVDVIGYACFQGLKINNKIDHYRCDMTSISGCGTR